MLILAGASAATIAGSLWAPWGEPPRLRKTPPSVDGGAGSVYPEEDILPRASSRSSASCPPARASRCWVRS